MTFLFSSVEDILKVDGINRQRNQNFIWPVWDTQQRPAYLFWILKQHQSFLGGFFSLLLPSTKPVMPEEKHCFWNNCNIYFSFNLFKIIEREKNAHSDSVISGRCHARQPSITENTHLFCLFVFSDRLLVKRSNLKVPHYAKLLLAKFSSSII